MKFAHFFPVPFISLMACRYVLSALCRSQDSPLAWTSKYCSLQRLFRKQHLRLNDSRSLWLSLWLMDILPRRRQFANMRLVSTLFSSFVACYNMFAHQVIHRDLNWAIYSWIRTWTSWSEVFDWLIVPLIEILVRGKRPFAATKLIILPQKYF